MHIKRLKFLAQPKEIPEGYVKNRRSIYWVDKLPSRFPTVFDISPRLESLVSHKQCHKNYVPDRPSPISLVSAAALKCPSRPRINFLAQPKKVHQDYSHDRMLPQRPSRPAQRATTSSRIVALATPKKRHPPMTRSVSAWQLGRFITNVSGPALGHVASERLEELAEPKKPSKEFVRNRSPLWRASPGLYSVKASERLSEIAQPIIRRSLNEGYDPYFISPAAKCAVASSRVNQLAIPIARNKVHV